MSLLPIRKDLLFNLKRKRPLNSTNPGNLVNERKFIATHDTGSAFLESVGAPTWIASATTAGTTILL